MRFLKAARGEATDRTPVWFMRQAGRYLPEYRRVREQVTFLELCSDVERAVEVSLQPIDLVGAEAVILFQDIFTPIPSLCVDVDFQPGPVIGEPIRTRAQVDALRAPDPRESVPFVFEILRTLRGLMGRNGLLGRRGAKWDSLGDALRIGRASPGVPLGTQEAIPPHRRPCSFARSPRCGPLVVGWHHDPRSQPIARA